MASDYKLKPFRFNLSDLNFIRDQINFRPLFDAAGNAIIAWDGIGAIYDSNDAANRSLLWDGNVVADPNAPGIHNAAEAIESFGQSYASVTAAQGLREVSGLNNNLLLVNSAWGAVDQPFLQRVAANFGNYVQAMHAGDTNAFHANTITLTGNTDYTKTAAHTGESIVDYTPRMISQLTTTADVTFTLDQGHIVKDADGFTQVEDYGLLETLGQQDKQNPDNQDFFIGATNPGVAPSNGWLVLFGQFFDHGLDFIGKGGDGTTITIPLSTDDPMYGVIGPDGQPTTKIVISRADVSGFDANGNAQWVNHTSPYIDQSQTYGSNDAVTQLLRKWIADPVTGQFHAGAELFDGATSVAWTNGFGETTNATLPTLNELRAHLTATGRDDLSWDDVLNLRNRDAATGDVVAGASGQALLLDMNPRFDTAHLSAATQAALHALGIDPIASGPNAGRYALGGPNSLSSIIDFSSFTPLTALAGEVLLESVGDHYIAGDGRANENVGLTAIHHVFHEEHNYQVRNIENAVLAQDARAVVLGDSTHAAAHDWQVGIGNGAGGFYTDAAGNYTLADGVTISWDQDKLFAAAKLTVEMEYQHTAVDQYARTITPDLPEFVGYNSGENATVSLDYAQVAFRFGHSTLRESIDIIDPSGGITGKVMGLALEKAFLNPQLFADTGAAAIALGMTHQQMNEVDEFITPALNQGLLGQPLDLAAINIARGRDIGMPTLNAFRAAIGLTAYTSWVDFGANMIHPDNLVNFIAAYSFDGDVAKAEAIIGLENGSIAEGDAAALGYTYEQALAFLSGGDLGYDEIDTWLGGLAEVHVTGGLLGETFNLVFVDQINRLMDGDRFYYLYRLNNMQFGDEIANAQFKDIIERNTGLTHLNGSAFAYADQYYDVSQTALANEKTEHKYGDTLAANPTLGVYTDGGNSTNGNGAIVTVNGVQYLRDFRVAGANGNPNITGENLDGTPDSGANSNEVLVGTDNKDILYMRAGDDTAYGEGGNDIIYGGIGIDRLYGGDGNDVIHGEDGGDLIDGGAGDDELWGESSASAAAGVDQIIGGEGNDIIHGGVGIDKLSGGSGDDVIYGDGDTDAFTHGGDGNDYIDGGSDGDLLWGDDGDDLIVGGNNQDIVAGLDGDDILRPGNPSSAMGGGPDEVLGGDGASDLGNGGVGTGFDMIDFSDYVAAPVGVTADFATQTNPLVAIDGTTPFPAWVGIEGLIGSRNNDTVLADANGNWLFGGSGNDTLTGDGGNDVIVGDGIRLDSLIGTYVTPYTGGFDGASHRALGLIGTNGLLDQAGPGFDKHYTEMLKSEIFKDIELGGSTVRTLSGGGTIGDGGTAGTADTAVFSGLRANYTVELISVQTANQGLVAAYKITDTAGDGGTDLVIGVERFQFSDVTVGEAQLLNAAPVITSDGGGAAAARTIAENTTAVTMVAATDANAGDTLVYSIIGGADAARFAIDATSGALSFLNAPNFEAPSDAGANNTYDVIVQASDGQLVDTQALAVTVQNVNEAATGSLRITGYTTGNSSASLTAANNIADPDGMSNIVRYQWQRQLNNGTWQTIAGAVAATLANQNNSTVRVTSGYTDPFGSYTQVSAETAIITANNNSNTRSGTIGNDILLGLGGRDTLTGLAGNDTVDGGRGNDRLIATAGDGNDAYIGGSGTDSYVLAGTTAGATVNLTAGLATSAQTGSDTLAGIEDVSGSTGNDVITDGAGRNSLDGNGGNDSFVLTLDNARDTINGGTGSDTADYSAFSANLSVTLSSNANTTVTVGGSGTGNNTDQLFGIENFTGGTGNDSVTGSSAANVLNGGAGNDRLTGGQGTDVLTGGAGADVFDFNAINETGIGAAQRDVITDFHNGADRLDFSTIDAITGQGGDQGFTFNASAGAGITGAGQLVYHYEGAGANEVTVIEGNVNTNLGVDFQLALQGHIVFNPQDLVL